MADGQKSRPETLGQADDEIPVSNLQPKFEIAWMQVRIGWQSVKRTRLDQHRKDAITTLIRHYKETGEADRLRFEFEQVLVKLEEELDYQSKELEKNARRSVRVQKSTMQVVRDNNNAWMLDCREKADETLQFIAEWKKLMGLLFPGSGTDGLTVQPE